MASGINAGSCWILVSVRRRKSTFDGGLVFLFLAWPCRSVVVGVRGHLAPLETAAERKNDIDLCREKLENVLRLQSGAAETRTQIHHLQ